MREIKFRAWNIEDKLYRYNVQNTYDYGCDNVKPHIMEDSFGDILASDYYIVEQYTGLKDKNGVEIYEGDIYQFQFMQELYKGVIKYKKELARYVIELEDLSGKWYEFPKQTDDVNYFCEVIGNIHNV